MQLLGGRSSADPNCPSAAVAVGNGPMQLKVEERQRSPLR